MNFQEYQESSRKTAIYPEAGTGKVGELLYLVVALSGELGELAEKVKKIKRDKNGAIEQKDKEKMSQELGDILWYLARFADALGLTLEQIAQANLQKLFSRKERGRIKGEGDDR